MPLGDYGAGMGPAGADPVYIPVAPTAVLPPRAVLYDPSQKAFLYHDANGNQTNVHPVDQIVAIRWTMQKGASPSNPDVGTRIRARFARNPPAKFQNIADDECRAAIADLLLAGDVQYLGVTVTTDPINGAVVVQAAYVNLRDPNTNQQQPQANAKGVSI